MKSYVFIVVTVLFCFLAVPALCVETIKIGTISSKTGEAKSISEEHLVTTRFAVREINNAGGVLGRELELIEFDNESTGIGSRNAARQAVEKGVVAVLGPSWSSHALASAPVLQKAGIPMISPTATNPKVTLVGDAIFRVCFLDAFQGQMLAKFASEDLKAQRAVLLINSGHIYSTELATEFKNSFEKLGGKVVQSIDYSEESTNYTEMLDRLAGVSYDVVFIPGYTRDSAQIIKAAADIGMLTTFLGGDGWSHLMFDYARYSLNGNYYLTHWDTSVNTEKSQSFVNKISKVIESPKINAGMALAYDGVYLLADAITRAKSVIPSDIRDALADTKSFAGVTGRVQFDPFRNPIKPAVILRFKNGTTNVVKIISQ